MRWIHTLSLKAKILGPIILMALVFVGLNSYWHYRVFLENLHDELLQRSIHLSHSVSYASQIKGRPSDVQRFVYALGGEANVSHIVIINEDGAIEYSNRRDWIGGNIRDKGAEGMSRLFERVRRTGYPQEEMHVVSDTFLYSLPVMTRGGKLSVVAIELDMSEVLEARTLEELEAAILAALGVFSVSLLGYWLLLKWVVRPLSAVRKAMNMRKCGNTDILAPQEGNDEIAVLARALNELSLAQEKGKVKLEQARDEALQSNRAKSAFLATMSHEIRTPMNAIVGFAALMRKTDLKDNQRQYLEHVEDNSQVLLSLINDILDLSKAESGKLEIEHASMSPIHVVEEVTGMLYGQAKGKRLDLHCIVGENVPDLVTSDATRLRQVLMNLVGNAIKFTAKGSVCVYVNACTHEQGKGWMLELRVKDTGIGMERESQKRIFDSFVQADASTTRAFGGTGLGLAIVRSIVNNMGGSIEVVSIAGEGSEFCVKVPVEVDPIIGSHEKSFNTYAQLRGKGIALYSNVSWHYEYFKELANRCAMSFRVAEGTALDDGSDIFIVDAAILSDIEFGDQASRILVVGVESQKTRALAYPLRHEGVISECIEIVSGAHKPRGELVKDPLVPMLRPGLRVLMAEDNVANQDLMEQLLSYHGISIETVPNGRCLLERLNEKVYDLVLMDVQMPEMGGVDATHRIRSGDVLSENRSIPIVGLTAHAFEQNKRECLGSGMDSFMTKPIHEENLIETIAELLKN